MRTVNMHEAKTQLSQLIRAVEAGEEVVIARKGIPTVKLVPVDGPPPRRKGGFWKGKVIIHDPDWWKPDDELADLFAIPKLPESDPSSRS